MIPKTAFIQGRILAALAGWEEMQMPVVWSARGLGDSKGSSERPSRCAVRQIKPNESNPLGFSLPAPLWPQLPTLAGRCPPVSAPSRCPLQMFTWSQKSGCRSKKHTPGSQPGSRGPLRLRLSEKPFGI